MPFLSLRFLVNNLHYSICLLNSNTLPSNFRFGFLIKIYTESHLFQFLLSRRWENPY